MAFIQAQLWTMNTFRLLKMIIFTWFKKAHCSEYLTFEIKHIILSFVTITWLIKIAGHIFQQLLIKKIWEFYYLHIFETQLKWIVMFDEEIGASDLV